MFYYWFTERPFTRTALSKVGTIIPQNKEVLTKFARVVAYMKLFAPVGTVINRRPDDSPDSPQYRNWNREIASLARICQDNLHAFVMKHTKKKTTKALFRPTHDYCNHRNGQFLQRLKDECIAVTDVVDHVTPDNEFKKVIKVA